jgi:hypothetical protein
MSASNHTESWLERNWSWLVILFGVIFVLCIDFYAPTI